MRAERRGWSLIVAVLAAGGTALAAESLWVKPPSKEALETIPGLRHQTFESRFMKTAVGYNVILPPSYEREKARRFPVVYWLHGGGGNESSSLFTAKNWRDLYGKGDAGIDEVILVYPNGFRSGYMDHADGTTMVESMIIKELIPRIDATLRTIAKREGRAVHGFSMGSSGALRFAIKYPHLFCSAAAGGGGAIDLEKTQDSWILDILQRNLNSEPARIREHNTYHFLELHHARLRKLGTRFLLICGDADKWMKSAEVFHADLRAREISSRLVSVPGIGHNVRKVYELRGAEAARFQDAAFKAAAR